MSFLDRIFDWLGSGKTEGPEAATIEHEGYRIQPAAIREGGQYRLSALISKEIGGEMKQHRMVRADTFASAEDANNAALAKAKRLIAEQGERIFA
jgi:hypothetical protein